VCFLSPSNGVIGRLLEEKSAVVPKAILKSFGWRMIYSIEA